MEQKALQIFYDLEVFDKMNLAGFLIHDPNGKLQDKVLEFINTPNDLSVNLPNVYTYINDKDASTSMLKRLRKGIYDIYGFNNHDYDDFVLVDVLTNQPVEVTKKQSDKYITKKYTKKEWPADLVTWDLRDQLLSVSLKKYESMRGLSVKESTVPFNKSDEFNTAELEEVIRYNVQDLRSTLSLFNVRNDDNHGNYLDNKRMLVEHYGTGHSYRYSNTTITSMYLMGDDRLKTLDPDAPKIVGVGDQIAGFLRHINEVNPLIVDAPKALRASLTKNYAPTSLTIEQFGNVFTFGSGGLHSAAGHLETTKTGKKKPVYDLVDTTDVYQLDVTSMFPNIMIRDELLGPATDKYATLVADRVANKKAGNPKAKTQKIVINATYGGTRSNWINLYNPKVAIHVNVAGIVSVYNLTRGLSKIGQIIQVNTDGVVVKLNNDPKSKERMFKIKKQWEEYFKLNLEVTHFKRLIQRDVNNYIAVKDNDHLKLKGGAIAQAQTRDPLKATTPTVLQTALLHHILNPDDDLVEYLNSLRKTTPFTNWCWTLSSTVSKLQTGYTTDANGRRLPQKVNRAYASTFGDSYYKERTQGKPSKFAGTSDKLVINNEDITDCTTPTDLDVKWYVNEVLRQYKPWVN